MMPPWIWLSEKPKDQGYPQDDRVACCCSSVLRPLALGDGDFCSVAGNSSRLRIKRIKRINRTNPGQDSYRDQVGIRANGWSW